MIVLSKLWTVYNGATLFELTHMWVQHPQNIFTGFYLLSKSIFFHFGIGEAAQVKP